MFDIIPSMLVTDEKGFRAQTATITNHIPFFQIDIADGKFAPNTTWAFDHADAAAECVKTDFELHLMVQDPFAIVKVWKGHPHLKRILLHTESLSDLGEAIHFAKQYDKGLGLVLNPDTPVGTVLPYLDRLDSVMFMGVNPGFQGQAFIPETLDRIRELRATSQDIYVEVDGAVNVETLPGLIDAGASAGCPGSAVFGHAEGPVAGYQELVHLAEKLSTR